MKRRRLSSDGFKLFNVAYTQPPSYSVVKKLLFCMYHTEYDDQLEKMVRQCRNASKQLYMLNNDKSINTNQLLNNAILNLIYSMMCKDDKLTNKHQVRRNMHYFKDVMEKAYQTEDHNTAIVMKNALDHTSLKTFKFKHRKKDIAFEKTFEKRYGTWRTCWGKHLKEAICSKISEDYIPSLMVLNMHKDRNRAYSNYVKLDISAQEIQARIGIYSVMNPLIAEDRFPLYETPPVQTNSDLFALANSIKG